MRTCDDCDHRATVAELHHGRATGGRLVRALIERPAVRSHRRPVELTLDAAMQKLAVPGMSIAGIRDFDIHWSRDMDLRM